MMRKMTHEEVVSRQERRSKTPCIPLTVVLNDIRSLYNVGSIFRTCDGAGVEKLYLCGITGTPPHNQISKTALGAETTLDWEYREDVLSVVREMKNRGYVIALLEQVEGSIAYENFRPVSPTCLILGNEITGITEDILKMCDKAVEIYMAGVKNSLNVAVAFGIVAYHLRASLRAAV